METGREMPWVAESFRMTAFVAEPFDESKLSWWKALALSSPEATSARPPQGEYVAEGSWNGNRLRLELGVGRIDWTEAGPVSPDNIFPTIPDVEVSFDRFIGATEAWLKESKVNPQRLAVGAILRIPVSDREEGYEQLKKYLPSLTVDTKNSRDLLYQINRPRDSKTRPDVTVNRLTKWGVIQINAFAVGPSSIAASNAPLAHFCRLEIDVSSGASATPNLQQIAVPFLRELQEAAIEIALHGDVP